MTSSPLIKTKLKSLYDADYIEWIEATLKKLQQQDYANVDWENLLDEIADMSRSEKRRLESNLVVVLIHLLKWQYQRNRRSRSWEASIFEHRRRIRRALRSSPSLKPYLEQVLEEAYSDAAHQAGIETGLPIETFPKECSYAITQILDEDFLPE